MNDNSSEGADRLDARPIQGCEPIGPMKIVIAVTFVPIAWDLPGPVDVVATISDGSTVSLFRYFPDELSFSSSDFVGRTVDEARALRHLRDVHWLRS